VVGGEGEVSRRFLRGGGGSEGWRRERERELERGELGLLVGDEAERRPESHVLFPWGLGWSRRVVSGGGVKSVPRADEARVWSVVHCWVTSLQRPLVPWAVEVRDDGDRAAEDCVRWGWVGGSGEGRRRARGRRDVATVVVVVEAEEVLLRPGEGVVMLLVYPPLRPLSRGGACAG
jgi:hypothetical protein